MSCKGEKKVLGSCQSALKKSVLEDGTKRAIKTFNS